MKNKRKLIIGILLFISVVGFMGYGVYSYYWTKGLINLSSEYIDLNGGFNPEVCTDSEHNCGWYWDYDFVGSSHNSVDLECTRIDYDGTFSCDGRIRIRNSGSTDVLFEISSAEVGGQYMHCSNEDYIFSWTSKTLSPGEYEDLYIDIDMRMDDTLEGGSLEAEYTEEEEGFSTTMSLDFDITATQVVDSD